MTNAAMRYVSFACILAAILLSMAAAALAEEQPAQPPAALPGSAAPAAQAAFAACNGDITKFCADVRPGRGRILRCLTAHDAELAPECRDGIAQARATAGR